MMISLLLILVQWILLKKEAPKIELALQVVISFVFGYFIDFSRMLLAALKPSFYPLKIVSLVVGCRIIAFDAYLEVVANVVMLPGDAFVRAISKVSKKEYGTIRVISDISMTMVAGILCILFLHELSGVREGTVFAALITENIVKFFNKLLVGVSNILVPNIDMIRR